MIHTSYRGELLVAYDRKSQRHNWNIIVSAMPDNFQHVQAVSEHWGAKARAFWGDSAPNYEQAIVLLDVSGGIIPDSLPKNVSFGPSVDGVYHGLVMPNERG